MTNTPNNRRNARINNMAIPDGSSVGEFTQYAGAVDCVDALIRHGFPAQLTAIVGSDLSTVERVRGKLSYGRVAIQGAITGSWLGLVIGILLPTDTATQTAFTGSTMGAAIVIGAGVGMLVNVIRFSATRRSHEFLSNSAVVAAKYRVVVPHNLVDEANRALAEHESKCINGQHAN